MLKACEIRKKKNMVELEENMTEILMDGYQRLSRSGAGVDWATSFLSSSSSSSSSLSSSSSSAATTAATTTTTTTTTTGEALSTPNVVKIQWLRSNNVVLRNQESEEENSSGRVSNAQDLHRDYENEVSQSLLAHSVLFTLDSSSHLIILPKSHKMTEDEIDEANEEQFYILKIPPYTMVFFHSQLAHAGPLFHVSEKSGIAHHYRGFAYLVKVRNFFIFNFLLYFTIIYLLLNIILYHTDFY